MVFLTFGTGMGAGLILNGELYRGTNDLAGEIGHVRISETGPDCYGKSGSFEGHCSGAGIGRMADESGKFSPGTTAAEIFAASEQGDLEARAIVVAAARILGKGIALLIDILNHEVVVIGSIFARQERALREGMEAKIPREAI